MKDIHVLVATGLYPPEIGGPATYIKMLEEKLPARGIQLHVVPFRKVRHLVTFFRHIVYGWLLFKEAKKCDIIFAFDPISVGFPAWVVSLLLRKPFIVRVAGDFAWEQGQLRYGVKDPLEVFYQKRFSYAFPVKIFSFVEGFVACRAQLVIVPSRYLIKVMREWGVNLKRVVPIYSALDSLPVSISKEEARTKLGYAGALIVSAGRLVPNKGFAALIKVFAQQKQEKDALHLVIVGDGPDEEKLRSLVEELGLTHAVHFTGKLDKTALGETIVAADVFVLNTEHEGLSHQLLEVMDLGVPIVSTAVGGNTELIEHGRSGSLVRFNNETELKDAIDRILEDTAYGASLASEAKNDLKAFDQDALVGELVEQLNLVFKGNT